MSRSREAVAVATATSTLGALSLLWVFLAVFSVFFPFPKPFLYFSGYTMSPFENWWYTLPDSSRTHWVYSVGTTALTIAYPVVIAAVFWVWCRPLRFARSEIPRRTIVLGVLGVGLSVYWYASGWETGLAVYGHAPMMYYVALSTLPLGFLPGLFYWRKHEPWWSSLFLHWGIFVWLFTVAFPFLGDL